ncbi:MAG: lysylphosphatidylglycerol synthase transmembrane domain-containing protein [Frankia sp.]
MPVPVDGPVPGPAVTSPYHGGSTPVRVLLTRLPAARGDHAHLELPHLELPHLEVPERVRWRVRRVALTVLTLGVIGLVGTLGGVEVARAVPALAGAPAGTQMWLLATAGFAGLTYFASAIELRAASGLTYPLSRGFAGQLAAAFGNRVLPAGLGAVGMNLRFLERAGLPRTSAITSLAVTKIVGVVAHTGILALAVALGATAGVETHLVTPGRLTVSLLAGAGAAVIVTAVALRGPFRRQVLPRAMLAVRQLALLATRPRAASTLLVASVGGKATHILALATTLAAFGLHPDTLTVAAIYLAGSSIAAAVPTPGGVGTIEAALVAGLVAAGQPAQESIAAVAVFRLITTWLPVLPGCALFLTLRRRGAL